MRKTLDEKYEKDLDVAREAIAKGRAAENDAAGGRISAERIEELIEEVHQVNRIDREAAERKLAMRLDVMRLSRRMRRRWLFVGGVAAAMALFFVAQPLLMPEEVVEEPVAPVVLGEITVPTIIASGADDEILAFDSLEIEDARNVYKAERDSVLPETVRKKVVYNRVVIPKGYTYRVELADGSRVTLNAGSELRYPVEFRDSLREVEFRGEGYFEVAKDAAPFVVRAGDARVRVYGTKFNFLYSDALSLSDKEVRIQPNERVYCSWTDSLLKTDKVDPADYMGWLGTSFKYNGARLDRIMFDMARWYGVEIAVSPEMRSRTYTLEIDKSTPVEETMRMMELITGKTIKQEGGAYSVY